MEFWLAVVLTALMGLSLGLLGGGGSTLAVPILFHVVGLDAHAAIAFSLVLVGSTALLAAWFHHRNHPLAWREALLFAAVGAPLSIGGGWLSRQVPGVWLVSAFGALMLVMGVLMFRPRPEPRADEPRHLYGLIAAGAGVGLLTGFLGVGGGFMIVPALVLFWRMPIKRAVGTSLLVISANCAVSVTSHWPALDLRPKLFWPLLAAALVGTFAGAELARRFTPPNLRRAFAAFILVVGAFMLARNLPLFQ